MHAFSAINFPKYSFSNISYIFIYCVFIFIPFKILSNLFLFLFFPLICRFFRSVLFSFLKFGHFPEMFLFLIHNLNSFSSENVFYDSVPLYLCIHVIWLIVWSILMNSACALGKNTCSVGWSGLYFRLSPVG